ncbi:hypothetical protein CHS0354_000139 [Potamilus streckersoni]|uniref:Uncharacterized protein n=1 Tax=Potamilus streckersoni TaxID=2493646 RepID=A0AAE0SXZ7_9BIVA|nr:hypothetical protein CHS0354_000139 [Potamilus streckersoni]
MWRRINLLFLVLYFFTEDICCDDPAYDGDDNSGNDAGDEGGESNEKDENPERRGNGKILIVVIPVVGVLVLLILVTCGMCILKKCNHKKIKTQNYQDKATMEKNQLALPTIVPDNPPPYSPKMEEGEMQPAPMEFLGYGTGWYAPAVVSMPPPYTKVVGQAFHPDSTAAPGY